jgi:hypothetical protein
MAAAVKKSESGAFERLLVVAIPTRRAEHCKTETT